MMTASLSMCLNTTTSSFAATIENPAGTLTISSKHIRPLCTLNASPRRSVSACPKFGLTRFLSAARNGRMLLKSKSRTPSGMLHRNVKAPPSSGSPRAKAHNVRIVSVRQELSNTKHTDVFHEATIIYRHTPSAVYTNSESISNPRIPRDTDRRHVARPMRSVRYDQRQDRSVVTLREGRIVKHHCALLKTSAFFTRQFSGFVRIRKVVKLHNAPAVIRHGVGAVGRSRFVQQQSLAREHGARRPYVFARIVIV
ncbi:hypothetical protein ACER0C_002199 [Sarotherodon galilaeus]